jgi:hypothetical protein
MRRKAKSGPVRAEQFPTIDFSGDRTFELLEGVIHMTAGGMIAPALISGNLFSFPRQALQGSAAGHLVPTPASW